MVMKHTTLTLLAIVLALPVWADHQCIDYTDLSSAVCQTAVFNDKGQLGTWGTRIVDNGPAASSSRHTVHTDPYELDARTSYQLHTTLPDGSPSVRLGNWESGKQAERITYTYTVPEDNPVLLLYYAVVLEEPGHEAQEQPRFTLELLKDGVAAESQCFSFDFKAGFDMDSAAWHLEMPGICWKDWTMMGITLSEFAGQTVQIRLTTYDCTKGEHYGYAYFGLACRSNKMQTSSCGDYTAEDAAVFRAPAGFNYRWYRKSEPTVTLSEEQTFTHTGPSVTYLCDIINKENEECYFTLEATPESRYPVAEFSLEQNSTGCADTIVVHNLSGVAGEDRVKFDPIQPCDNYLWDFGDGRTSVEAEPKIVYEQPGEYTITLTAGLNGWQCASSAFTRTVTVSARKDAVHQSGVICEGETFMWHGKAYTQEGSYADPLATNALCGEILDLTVHPMGKKVVYDTICHGDSYTWRGAVLSESGVYTDTAYNRTADGCDSVYYLNLAYYTRYDRVPQSLKDKLGPASVSGRREVTYYSSNADPWDDPYMLVHIEHETVDASSFTWHGHTYTESGVYMDTIPTALHGCDSIVFLDLVLNQVEHQKTIVPEEDSFCEGTSYNWEGRDPRFSAIKEAGIYNDTVINTSLDTTVYILTLSLKQSSSKEVNLTVCNKQIPYVWNGITCTKADDYTYTTVNAAGCDSVVTLHLEVNTYSASEESETVCEAELPYEWNGIKCTKADDYTYTTVNSAGCDSIVTLHLAVAKATTGEESVKICDKLLPYAWNGIICTKADDYTYTTVNAAGCDSVVTMHLTVLHPSTGEESISICDSELPYKWNGITCTKADDYTYTTVNAAGCDSVVTLHLNVLPSSSTKEVFSLCDSELPYVWNGITCTKGGDYTYTTVNAAGCDSVVTLQLAVRYKSAGEQSVKICEQELPYMWNGITCTQGGDYTYTTVNAAGCDSVATLHLTTESCVPPCAALQAKVTLDTLCADDRYLPLEIEVSSGRIRSYEVRFDEAARKQGFNDLPAQAYQGRTPDIAVPRNADTTRYVRPDNYNLTLTLTDTCGGVQDFKLSFTVLYPAWIILQRWNDVLALLNERYNGGYTFSSIRWFHEGSELEARGEHNSYIYILPTLGFEEAYWAELTRTDDGKTFRTCYKYPHHTNKDRTSFVPEKIRLVPAEGRRYCWQVSTELSGTYMLYDVCGRMLRPGRFGSSGERGGAEDILDLSDLGHAGCFLVVFHADDGTVETKKLTLQ